MNTKLMLLASQKTFLKRAVAPFARSNINTMHPSMFQRRLFSTTQSMSVEEMNH